MLRALILIALVALAAAADAQADGSPVAFVAVPARSEVVAVDLTAGRVVARVSVPRGPQELAAIDALSNVLVASPAAGTVTQIDALTQGVVKVWRDFGRPTDVVVDGIRGYVTDTSRGRLVVIDLVAQRIVARIPVGAQPHAVAVGDLAVVAHRTGSSLTLVDVRRRRIVGSLPVGAPVQSLSKEPDTTNVYVTFQRSGVLARVDWGSRQVGFRREVAAGPADVVKDIYVGDNVWLADGTGNRVLLVSARTGKVRRVLRGCSGALRLAQVGAASIAATCPGDGSIALWANRGRKRSLTSVGGAPAGIAISIYPFRPTAASLLDRSLERGPMGVQRAK